jgi:hypothetical protein
MNSNVSENPRLTRDDDDSWVLVLERTLEHPREEVWAALTDLSSRSPVGDLS